MTPIVIFVEQSENDKCKSLNDKKIENVEDLQYTVVLTDIYAFTLLC